MKKELFVAPGGMNKALVAARRFLSERTQAKLNEKFYEEIPVEDQKRERGNLSAQLINPEFPNPSPRYLL